MVKLSSAHVYLRMPEGMVWTSIPEALLEDCAQLVKANSIEGMCPCLVFLFLYVLQDRKQKEQPDHHLYTSWQCQSTCVCVTMRACSWKKTGDMAVGAVCFHNDRQVKRFYVKERKNEIVNRLNKTKEDRLVDYEAERQERERAIGRKKKEFALKQV